jgi:m7GpppX diphosphatase
MESKLYLNENDYHLTFKKLINENDKYKTYMIEALIMGKIIEKPIEDIKQNKIISESVKDYQLLNVQDTDKNWIYNIIDHKSESENIIYENDNLIFIPDYKWDNNIKNLHILGIFKNKNLNSIRDLNKDHIKILEECIIDGKKIIKEKYHIDNLIIYFHYRPSVWQLHIHFINIDTNNKDSFTLPRAHLVSNVIQNLKYDTNYYKNANLEVLI